MSLVTQKSIIFKGNSYIIKFPVVWQIIEIENVKMALTNEKYSEIASQNLKINVFQLDLVDTIAYFQVLAPEIKENLGLRSLRDMDAVNAKELMTVFKEQFIPWYKPLMEDLMNFEPKKSDDKTTDPDDQQSTTNQ